MKSLKSILLIVGVILITVGLIQAFVPETVFKLGPIEVEEQEGLSTQTIAFIIGGVVALILGGVVKRK